MLSTWILVYCVPSTDEKLILGNDFMKHILRLVNYCKNTITSTQPTFLPWRFGLYQRPSCWLCWSNSIFAIILGNFFQSWGLLCPVPSTDKGQIWCVKSRGIYAHTPNFIWICRPTFYLFCCIGTAKNPNFLPVFGFRHFVMSPFSGVWRKLNTGAQLQNFPYLTVSKSCLYSN